jgi:hypothetical protein
VRKRLLLAAAFAAIGLPAHSQPVLELPRRDVAPPEARRAPHLFISPSGEPFHGPDGLGAWFAQADADHDGSLTAAEFRTDADRAFRLYDTDGDGVIDGLEIQAYERERVPEIGEIPFGGDEPRRRGRGRGPGGAGAAGATPPFRGAGTSGAAQFSLLNEPEPLLAADEDIDGKITRAEWGRAAARRFARLDHDGGQRLILATLRTPPKR